MSDSRGGPNILGGSAASIFSDSSLYSNSESMGIRRRMRIFLEDPSSSSMALAFAIFVAFAVVLSSTAVILETLPAFYRIRSRGWFWVETSVIVVFSLEFVLRCFAHSTTIRRLLKFLCCIFAIIRNFLDGLLAFSTLIDLLAIAPYFVELVVLQQNFREFQRLTVFRLFRLFRLVRCYSYSSVLQLSIDALLISLYRSIDALMAILVFVFLVIIVFSTLIYFAERGEYDQTMHMFIDSEGHPSQFDSIPATFWYVAEVLTTVGLGDYYPKTVFGKMISFPLMLFGLLIIALPSIVVGRNFAEAWAWLKTSGLRRGSAITAVQSIPRAENRGLILDLMNQSPSKPSAMPNYNGIQCHQHAAQNMPKPPGTQPLKSAVSRNIGSEDLREMAAELRRNNNLLERLLSKLDAG